MKNTFLIFSLLLLVVASCRRGGDSKRLDDINALTESSRPDSALTLLAEINADSLSKADGAYFSLLKIKAADKAYIRHTSDSAIMEVLKYYEDHKSDVHYPEALYYAGNVYADLGDYPKSLRYFHEALDLLPKNTENLKLRGNVLSQIAWILNALHLYVKAIPYINESINVDDKINDELNKLYDLQLLGAIYLHLNKLDSAQNCFNEIWRHKNLTDDIFYTNKMYIAAIEFKKGKNNNALELIRGVPEKISDEYRTTAYGYAAKIYLKADFPDTAFYYSNLLIKDKSRINEDLGYHLSLTPNLIDKIPSDSLNAYFRKYAELAYLKMERNSNRAAFLQDAQYNYSTQLRDRIKAENSNLKLARWLIFVLSVLIIVIILYFISRIKSKNKIIELKQALENLTLIEKHLSRKTTESSYKTTLTSPNETILRQKLLEKIGDLVLLTNEPVTIDAKLKNSDVYERIISKIRENSIIGEKDSIWWDLEQEVSEASPHFKYHITLLTHGRLKEDIYRMCMLMKCGFKPSHIALLVGRSKNAISGRRKKLCETLSIDNNGNLLDNIIIRL